MIIGRKLFKVILILVYMNYDLGENYRLRFSRMYQRIDAVLCAAHVEKLI